MEINDQMLQRLIENALFTQIKKGDFFKLDYQDRINFSPMLQDAYKRIDYDKVRDLITKNLEEVIAEKVVNKIVTEMGTDIKSLMCKAEIREDFKYMMRKGVEKVLEKVEA